MILVQKQLGSHFSLNPVNNFHHHHRRNPSAPPAVVVQPTRTPGLLSLSKPIQRAPAQRPAPRNVKNVAPKTPAHPAQAKPPAALEGATRGRHNHQPKDKQTRSASHSSVRGSRRTSGRQPSPPINSSQAEDPNDPFIDHESTLPVRTAPLLTTRPSGKLARRRQHKDDSHHPFELPPSKPVPVPSKKAAAHLSKSVPTVSHVHAHAHHTGSRAHKRASAIALAEDSEFPICDDMTEAGDLSEEEELPVSKAIPVTPTRPRVKHYPASNNNILKLPVSAGFVYDDGPKTAPLSSQGKGSVFPFPRVSPSSSPSSKKSLRGRKHVRSPSEGVFMMSSSDSDSSKPSGKQSARHSTDELKALFGLPIGGTPPRQRVSTMQGSTRPPTALPLDEEKGEGYFASSLFQNSPSPEDLPPPPF